jgi:hypothetical protein
MWIKNLKKQKKMNELKEEEREEKRKYLLEHNWYQILHKDYWLQKGKKYSNPNFEGLITEDAYKEQKRLEP